MNKLFLLFIFLSTPLLAVNPPPATTDTAVTNKFVRCIVDDTTEGLAAFGNVIYVNLAEVSYFYIRSTYLDSTNVAHYRIILKQYNKYMVVDEDFAGLASAQNFIDLYTQPIP